MGAPTTERTADLLKGWNFSPVVVGIVRGAIEAGVLAVLGYLSVQLTALDWGQYAAFSPGAFWLIRTLEAQADQWIDPQQNRIQSISDQKETRA